MKKIDKVILILFSVIIFLQSILVVCVISGILNLETAEKFVEIAFSQDRTSKIILAVTIICWVCSVKCIFFESSDQEKNKSGVLMQNDNGKLLISKSTLENIVKSVVKDFEAVEDVAVSTELDGLSGLIVNVNLVISKNVIIKELTLNMQNKIKDAIKRTSDLDVKEVNVKIKNITSEVEEKK